MPLETWAAYCPQCSVTVVDATAYQPRADDGALMHARVTGHVVQVVNAETWTSAYSVPGAPPLPF